MKNLKSLLNIAGLGCAATVTLAGAGMKNPYLTFTGINLGMSGSIVTLVSKKSQQQQQQKQVSMAIYVLTQQIAELKTQTKQQQQNIQLQQSTTQIQNKNLDSQLDSLLTNLEDTNNNFLQQQQHIRVLEFKYQQTIKERDKLSFAVNNAQRQLNNHNKKFKKQQQEINTQKANQNKVTSSIQKLKNQQEITTTNNTKYLNKIEAQVDKLIEIAAKKPVILSQSNNPKKAISAKLRRGAIAPILQRKPQTLAYIDNNNLFNCLKEMGIEPDYKAFLCFLTSKIGQTQIKLYDGAFPNQKYKYAYLKNFGYQITTLPIVKRGKDGFKTVGDDVQLAIDMVEEVKSGDSVILVTGDGDLLPAVKKIKQRNVQITVIAKKSSVNQDLRKLADEFISLESIKYEIAKHTLYPHKANR